MAGGKAPDPRRRWPSGAEGPGAAYSCPSEWTHPAAGRLCSGESLAANAGITGQRPLVTVLRISSIIDAFPTTGGSSFPFPMTNPHDELRARGLAEFLRVRDGQAHAPNHRTSGEQLIHGCRTS